MSTNDLNELAEDLKKINACVLKDTAAELFSNQSLLGKYQALVNKARNGATVSDEMLKNKWNLLETTMNNGALSLVAEKQAKPYMDKIDNLFNKD